MDSNGPGPWVSSNDYSSVPSVIAWLIGTICALCVLVKFAVKVAMERKVSKDDIAISISMLISVGFVAGVSFAAANGLGTHQSTLSEDQIRAFEKSVYAANLTYIASLFFSKGAVLFLLSALTPVPRHRTLIWTATALVAIWTLSSIFTVAFQCPLPDPWTILQARCINQSAFWIYSNVMNMITELSLCAIPLIMFKTVKIRLAVKITINTIFVLRLFLLGSIIAELYFRQQLVQQDQTFGLWTVTLCMTVTQGLSIIFACAPFLKPFFAALETGMVRLDDARRLSATTLYGDSTGKAERALLHEKHESGSDKTYRSSGEQRNLHGLGLTPPTAHGWTEIGRASPKKMSDGLDGQQAQHTDQGIFATTTFEVRSEDGYGYRQGTGADQPPRLPPVRPISGISSLWRNSVTSN